MAPKQDKAAAAARSAAKKKAAEDKTFGLKNKNKSAKVQKYVQNATATAGVNQKDKRAQELADKAKKEKKAAEEARKRELEQLFAATIKQPKVPAGVDPKSLLCEFFRHGQCTKGFKCKFSHDPAVERKAAKIDLFTDQRDLGDKEGGEGMEDWDQDELERVVAEKHAGEKPSNATTIICKFFLDAVEKRQYGWFWKCPNGADCKYRHALPAGYVLKSQMKELLAEEAAKVRDITEVIEEERAAVAAVTPITQAVFEAWHARKRAQREVQRAAEAEERKKKGVLNGREIFLQDNFVALDDANAGGDDEYARASDDEEAAINEMFEQARKAQEAARQASGPTPEEAAAGAGAGASSSSAAAAAGAGASSISGAAEASNSSRAAGGSLQLDAATQEALFGDDDSDDDDDDGMEEDEDEDEDLDPEQLAQLETQLRRAAAV